MQPTLFISDLHLSPQRPETLALFLRFLQEQAAGAAALYILGDLFDAWIGDDNSTPPVPDLLAAIRRIGEAGCQLYVMHGNRDFLLGERFTEATGCQLIPDPSVVEIDGQRLLLMHGDLLCTDDLEYQQARRMLRSPEFIDNFLSHSIPERIQLAAEYRQRSGEVVSLKSADIMDVNEETVLGYLQQHNAQHLIHGHTHRPGQHLINAPGLSAQRHVLGDWQADGAELLRLVDGQFEMVRFG